MRSHAQFSAIHFTKPDMKRQPLAASSTPQVSDAGGHLAVNLVADW
jgi:hypothetical protein